MFGKGVGRKGLATGKAQDTAEIVPQNCVPLLLRGLRKKGGEKRSESQAWEGSPRANPLCPPTPFRVIYGKDARGSGQGVPAREGVGCPGLWLSQLPAGLGVGIPRAPLSSREPLASPDFS